MWIGGQLHPLENVPPVLAVLLVTVVIAFFTEFASNTATIIIFLPVLAELVRVPGRGGVGPLPGDPGPETPPRGPGLHLPHTLPRCAKCQDYCAVFFLNAWFVSL